MDHDQSSTRYELSHDTVARQVFDKASAEAQTRRKIEKYVHDRFAMYAERGSLLTQDDLDYVGPYLDAIHLREEERAFIGASRKALRRVEVRRRAQIGSVIAVLAGFGGVMAWLGVSADRARAEAEGANAAALDSARVANEARNESVGREMQAAAIAIMTLDERAAQAEHVEALAAEMEAWQALAGRGSAAQRQRLENARAESRAAREKASVAQARTKRQIDAFDPRIPLQLGSVDEESFVPLASDITGYFQRFQPGMPDRFRGEAEGEWFDLQAVKGNRVADFQAFLQEAGFLPDFEVDGIFGYRTHAAARLWYEHIRTVERDTVMSVGVPDGAFGLSARYQLLRWKRNGLRFWDGVSADNPTPEYAEWMAALESIKAHYATAPSPELALVDTFRNPSDTRRVSDWDFNPEHVHLIGIRRNRTRLEETLFDDVFLLLINGLVFKFAGSTQPGYTRHPKGAPYLIPGQHVYRQGWHKRTDMNRVYRALNPGSAGVLAFRDGDGDGRLSGAERTAGPEINPTINIDWGGGSAAGIRVLRWSEGTQVIRGNSYVNAGGERIDYSGSAFTYNALGQRNESGEYVHRGAYTVLIDLIWALSPTDTVLYTLIDEEDLDLVPGMDPGRVADIFEQLLPTDGEESDG